MGKLRIFLIFILVTIAGLISGYLLERRIVPPLSPNPSLPLPTTFLVNPVLDNVYANAEGSVIAKTEDSFVIEKDNQQITLFVEDKTGLTTFSKQTSSKQQSINFNEVQVGDYVRGGVSIVITADRAVGLAKKRNVGDILAHRFMVETK